MSIYGYVRVSSADQNEDRQIIAMREKGVPEKSIFTDKQSGKDFERPQYKKLLQKLQKGDLLYILSIDRLGRNYEEIQAQWRFMVKVKEIDICVIDMPILDTRPYKDLLGTFISDLFLQVLAFVAQTEREHIKERQAQGMAAAKARGVTFGRPRQLRPNEYENLLNLYDGSAETLNFITIATGLSARTIYRDLKKYGKAKI